MDMPQKCLKCPLLDGNDECIMQDEDANFCADTWDKLKEGCPLREIPEQAIDAITARSWKGRTGGSRS